MISTLWTAVPKPPTPVDPDRVPGSGGGRVLRRSCAARLLRQWSSADLCGHARPGRCWRLPSWRHGVHAGDHVGVCLPNCPEIAVAFFGLARLGARDGQHQYTTRGLGLRLRRHRQRVLDARDRPVVASAPRAVRGRSRTTRSSRCRPITKVRRAQTGWDLLVDGDSNCGRAGTSRRQRPRHDPVHLRQHGMPKGCVAFPPLLARARPGVGQPRARFADPRRRAVLLHGGSGERGAGDVGRRHGAPPRAAEPPAIHAVDS